MNTLQKIEDPEDIEDIACADLLFIVALAEVEQLEHVCMPWFEINGKCAKALVTTLVDTSRCRVERMKQRDDAVRTNIRSDDVCPSWLQKENIV